jgi:diaminopimelate decarboxylase
LRVAGVSLHIGSQITEVAPFAASMERAAGLVEQLIADGHPIRFVDAGGGLGISYTGSTAQDLVDNARRYAAAVTQRVRQIKAKLLLLLEPGRFIVGPAGALVTRVLFRKQNGSKRFVIVDAAMNDLLRPSLYGAKHEITPVTISSSERRTFLSDIAGPVCETGDFLARDIEVPHVAAGEYLCVLDTGAYGMSLASNYNTRPRAAEILVDGAKAKLVRRREKLREMLQPELSCL